MAVIAAPYPGTGDPDEHSEHQQRDCYAIFAEPTCPTGSRLLWRFAICTRRCCWVRNSGWATLLVVAQLEGLDVTEHEDASVRITAT